MPNDDAGMDADAAWALSLIAPPSPDLVASADAYGPEGFCADVWVPLSKWDNGHSLVRLPFRHGTTRGQVRDVFRGLGVAMKEGK